MSAPFIDGEFLAAIAAAGLTPVKQLSLPDGKIIRYRVEGDKAGSRNGWAILNRSPILAGAFG
jgi:putative DNA primase/helicase